eukprot:TRINITY_DN8368_c0_g1_i1.p1 TRINITY_DN8368_c0_g1~~TRINITY_DN8368_c0_g1_i1.p1  ORF type:complete len:159 (-),score=54.95 TRINITY_DN8368_c0_g1_i1:73-549(-)
MAHARSIFVILAAAAVSIRAAVAAAAVSGGAPGRPRLQLRQQQALRGEPSDVAYARRVLEEVLERTRRAQIADTTKAEYCSRHPQELRASLDEAEEAHERELTQQLTLKQLERECGCCCNRYNQIQLDLSSARRDLEFQENRLQNLEKQIELLKNFCS